MSTAKGSTMDVRGPSRVPRDARDSVASTNELLPKLSPETLKPTKGDRAPKGVGVAGDTDPAPSTPKAEMGVRDDDAGPPPPPCAPRAPSDMRIRERLTPLRATEKAMRLS
jgi:hypothetical protein